MTLRRAVCVGVLLAGCVVGCFDDAVDPAAAIGCESDSDCPAGALCRDNASRCVPEAEAAGRCGDGLVDDGEACDDANVDESDACTSLCRFPQCGDDDRNGDEECDDGAGNAVDALCLPTCRVAVCGDGFLRQGEACDDGDRNRDDGGCSSACTLARCGDGLVFAGVEVCDRGDAEDWGDCRRDCGKIIVCGDGVVEGAEACDDANENPADQCDACRVVTWAATVIGGGGALTENALALPQGIALDLAGNIYIAETRGNRVRRISPDGTITTIAGTGTQGRGVDGPATASPLIAPRGIAVDTLGNVYFTDSSDHRLRKVDRSGAITTIFNQEGRALNDGDGGPATAAAAETPAYLAVHDGEVFFVDLADNTIRFIDTAGIVHAFAGVPHDDDTVLPPTPSGTPALAFVFNGASGVAVDDNDVYVADRKANRVQRINKATRIVETHAGTGENLPPTSNPNPVLAVVPAPIDVALAPNGDLYVLSAGRNSLQRINASGVTEIVDGGAPGYADGLASTAKFRGPSALAIATDGRVFVADTENSRVRVVDVNADAPAVTTVAGDGTVAGIPATGRATEIALDDPFDAVFWRGELVFTEQRNRVIRRLDSAGQLHVVAGNGLVGQARNNDGGRAANTSLQTPSRMAVTPDNALLVVELNRGCVVRIDEDERVRYPIGTCTEGDRGDGGLAADAEFGTIDGIAVDAAGNVYVADADNRRVRVVSSTDGFVRTIAGTGEAGVPTAVADARDAQFGRLSCLAIFEGDLLVCDQNVDEIWRLSLTTRALTPFAGGGTTRAATSAALAVQLQNPTDLVVDGAAVYVVETAGRRVRRIENGVQTLVLGQQGAESFAGSGVGAVRLSQPSCVLLAGGVPVVCDTALDRVSTVVDGVWQGIAGEVAPPTDTLQSTVVPGLAATVTLSGRRFLLGRDRLFAHVDDDVEVVLGYPSGNQIRDIDIDIGFADRFDAAAGLAVDGQGRFYVSDAQSHAIYVIDEANGIVRRAFGTGVAGYVDVAVDDLNNGVAARLNSPHGLAIDGDAMFVADTGNHVVRRVDLLTGAVTTVAGVSDPGDFGDDGPATAALFNGPEGVAVGDGLLYISDTQNHRVRVVDAAGVVTTVLGEGSAASTGEGAPARTLPVDTPRGLAVDAHGNLFVASRTAVRQVLAGPPDADGRARATGSDAVITIFGAPPRGGVAATTDCLTGVEVDGDDVLVTDACRNLLVRLARPAR